MNFTVRIEINYFFLFWKICLLAVQLFDYLCYTLSTAVDKQAGDLLDGVSKLLMSSDPPAAWYNNLDHKRDFKTAEWIC